MGIDFVGRAEGDVDTATVQLPAGGARSEMFVGVRDAAVMLFFELVFNGVRGGIAAEPELLDELFALLVGVELLEGFALFIGDDVGDVLVQPLLPRSFEFLFERGFFRPALLVSKRLSDSFALLVGFGGGFLLRVFSGVLRGRGSLTGIGRFGTVLLCDGRRNNEKKSQAERSDPKTFCTHEIHVLGKM